MMAFSRADEEAFAAHIRNSAEVSAGNDIGLLEKEVTAMAERDRKIDRLYATLYEDSVNEKITEERFAVLSMSFEREQAELRERLNAKRRVLDELTGKQLTTDHFLQALRRYTQVKKLTTRMMNELIQKIEVHQAKKVDGIWVQKLAIHFHFLGIVSIPENKKVPFETV